MTRVVRKSPSLGLKTGVHSSLNRFRPYNKIASKGCAGGLNNSTKWEGYLYGKITLHSQ